MTNFIRTDQEHKRCPGILKRNRFIIWYCLCFSLESTDEKESSCTSHEMCKLNKEFQKVCCRSV